MNPRRLPHRAYALLATLDAWHTHPALVAASPAMPLAAGELPAAMLLAHTGFVALSTLPDGRTAITPANQ